MMRKLRELPLQKSLGLGAFAVAAVAFVWATFERGLFDGITLLIAASALVLSLLQRLPTRPRLDVGLRDGESPLIAKPAKAARPFDVEQIVEERAAVCREEMPRMPRPQFPPGSPLIEPLAGFQASERLLEVTSGVTDEGLRKHLRKIDENCDSLREWLGRVEALRADRLRLFESELRVRELGRAGADHVHLRLRFPDGFQLDEQPHEVGKAPERPYLENFRRSLGQDIDFSALRRESATPIRLPGTDKPLYSTEDGRVQIDFNLGRLNQSDHLNVPRFRLRAPAPGEYEITWEVTADGLNKPAQGRLRIRVEAPDAGDPIRTLADAEAERKAYE